MMKIPAPKSHVTIPPLPKIVYETDHDIISIPRTRYEEFIRAETELDVLLRAYQQHESYNLEAVMLAVFGPEQKEAESDA